MCLSSLQVKKLLLWLSYCKTNSLKPAACDGKGRNYYTSTHDLSRSSSHGSQSSDHDHGHYDADTWGLKQDHKPVTLYCPKPEHSTSLLEQNLLWSKCLLCILNQVSSSCGGSTWFPCHWKYCPPKSFNRPHLQPIQQLFHHIQPPEIYFRECLDEKSIMKLKNAPEWHKDN